MKTRKIKISGLNIQWPWSQLIVSGKKIVETRSYDLPKKFLGKPLAIIETAGPKGKQHGISKARIIGIVIFAESFQYQTKAEWLRDNKRHLVPIDDKQFQFVKTKPKFGWVISEVAKLMPPVNPPKKRGIVFASNCEVEMTQVAI